MIEPLSFTFLWNHLSMFNDSSVLFEVTCHPLFHGIPIPYPEVTEDTTLTMSNLSYGVTDNCSVLAIVLVHELLSMKTYLVISTTEIAITYYSVLKMLTCTFVFSSSNWSTKRFHCCTRAFKCDIHLVFTTV